MLANISMELFLFVCGDSDREALLLVALPGDHRRCVKSHMAQFELTLKECFKIFCPQWIMHFQPLRILLLFFATGII